MGTQAGQVGDEKFSNWVKDTLALLYTKECLEVIVDERSAVFHSQLKAAVGNNLTCSCGWQALEKGKKKWVVKNCPGVCQSWLDLIIDHHSKHPLPKLAPSNTDPSLWPSDTWEVMKVYQSIGCQGQRSAWDADVAALIDLMRNCDHFSPLITNPSFINKVILTRNSLMHSKDFLVDNQQLPRDLQSMLDFLDSLVDVSGASALSATELQAVRKAIAQVDELRTSILDMTMDRELPFKAIKAKQVALEQMINDARATIDLKSGREDKLSTKVQTLQDSLNSQLSLIQDVKKGLSNQKQSAATVVTTLARVQQQFDDLKKDLDEIKTETTALIQQISYLEETSQNLQQESQAHESQLEQHQGELDTHATTLQDHATQLQGHQSHIESQQRTLGSHATQLQGHQSHIESQQRTLDSHATQLHGHQSHIESQQRTLECHGAKLDRLENKQIAQQTDQPVNIKHLQCHLISLYEAQRQHIPVYLLRSERKVRLEDIYVEQRLRVVDPDGRLETDSTLSSRRSQAKSRIIQIRQQDNTDADKPEKFISSLKDVFYNTDGNKCQYVYVSGNAGYGKSVFCSHLVRLWCKAHSEKTRKLTPDQEMMAEFPLLFCIDLSDATYKAADQMSDEIISLIQKQLQLSQLGVTDNNLCKLLQADGKVLVVMDALDECKEERLPRRGLYNKCTTLVTSRPWKFEALRFDPECRVDKELEMVGLKKGSPENLSENLVKLLNKKWNRSKDSFDFIIKMEEEGLEEFLDVPVLLTSMLCLWFDDIPFGQSQTEIYKNSIHHQMLVAVKSKDIPEYTCQSETPFPVCKRGKCPCKRYETLLWKVSESACKALLGNVREQSLVLDHTQREFLGLTDKDVLICLKLGILTQYKLLGNLTDYEPKKSVSFTHKTYQEWFAAIYLSTKLPVLELDKMLSEAIDDLDSALKLDKIFLFVCGMHGEIAKILSELIMTKASSDARVKEYLRYDSHNHDQLIRTIQDVVVAGAVEAKKNNMTSWAPQLHDVYIEGFMFRKFSTDQILACDTSHATSIYINFLAESDYANIEESVMITPWPASSCLECMELINIEDALDDTFCDNFSAAHLVYLGLSEVTLTHAQLEKLCGSLASAGSLKMVCLNKVTCTTHRNHRQECSIMLNLSQHLSLEAFVLNNLGEGDLMRLSLCQKTDKLEYIVLDNITQTHDELQKLCLSLASARKLSTLVINMFSCTTHKDNRQECSIMLDLSQHHGLENLLLNLGVGERLCLSQNMDNLKEVMLEDITLSHDQLESLCGSLASGGKLSTLGIDKLSCATHKDNRQECSIMLDISQHHGLENLVLDGLGMGEDLGLCLCTNMNKLKEVLLENITLTHDQLESLCGRLTSARSLSTVNIRKLFCTTHKHNRQECSIVLDLSQHIDLENLKLYNLGVGVVQRLCLCQKIDKLKKVKLINITFTHDQIESLYESLASAVNLKKVYLSKLYCTTHMDNKLECSIILDLSQHQRLEKLKLEKLCLGGVKGLYLCKNMDTLQNIELDNIKMTHGALESLCGSLASTNSLKTVYLNKVTCTTHKNNKQECSVILDLSQHQRLEDLKLYNRGTGEIQELRLCQNTVQLESADLPNITLTHDQLERFCARLATVGCLKTVEIRKLTCTIHKGYRQECRILLDLSKHQGLETLFLDDLFVGEVQGLCLCLNMDKLKKVVLKNITQTHDQLERLCESLASARSLSTVYIRKLSCATHMANRQECSIMLDLSHHQRLENLQLDSIGVIEAWGLCLCPNMDKLLRIVLENSTQTHDQLERLFGSLASARSLRTVEIRKLICTTHKEGRQACCIMLDLSQHQGLENLELDNPGEVEEIGLCLCQNMDKIGRIVLKNISLTHDQLESLCGSLTSARMLSIFDIRKLSCTTHKDNRQECSIMLDLSHHQGLENLRLFNLGVGEEHGLCLYQNMNKLKNVLLEYITQTHDQLQILCGNLASARSLSTVDIRNLSCTSHMDNRQECNIVLDFSRHEGIVDLVLCNLGKGMVRELSLCRNMDTLEKMVLQNITLTHDQLECLCGGLAIAGSLTSLNIRELDCSTHKVNKHKCVIMFGLSQSRKLKHLTLWELGIGEVQGVNLCLNMDKLQKVHLAGFGISAAALRQTIEALSGHSLWVELGDLCNYSPLSVRGAQEARQLLEEIRQATNTLVTRNRVEYKCHECIVKEFLFFNDIAQ